jgi:large subunit ribosomal protein L10
MDRDQKAAQVEEMTAKLGDAEAIFAVDYRGISVPQAAELRTRLAEADATFRIVKNRLAKLAADNAGTEGLVELLEGPTALTFVKGDPVTAAKALATFGREHKLLEFKGGLMEGAALAPEQFQAIARLPGLDVLHGQLVGVAASPITGLARGLGAMLSGLAIGLGQIQEKGLVAGDAEPQPEEEAEEPKAEAEPEDQGEPEAEDQPQPDETEDESSSEESKPQAGDSEDTEKEE